MLIELRHVSKSYSGADGGAPVTVLDDINLEVRDGEMLALLGQSGSGKSTILRLMAGLTEPTHGIVLSHGARFDGVNHRLGFLRGRGAVEVMPVSDARELVADLQILPETGRGTIQRMVEGAPSVSATRCHLPVPGRIESVDVHTTLRSASRAASRIESGSFALSHRPEMKPSSRSARAPAGSSPRLSA